MTSSATFPVSRPSLGKLGTEPLRAALEFISFKLAPKASAAAGDGHPVIIFPGLGTDGSAVAPLRDHCRALGYAAMDWGRGFNTGPQGQPDVWLAELAAHTEKLLA
ncbi:MAG: hypothetical protein Q8S56_05920, partial [Polaromonas sp.]|nr:hypothetical protein [Polaromonas sp.]